MKGEPQYTGATPGAASTHLLPLQLQSLEQQRFAWSGEVWPGQSMQWDVVQEDSARQTARPGAETAPAWQTVLQLEMPRLGKLKATIRLQGEHAQLQLQAQDPQSVGALTAQGAVLGQALAASGTALDALTVQADEPA